MFVATVITALPQMPRRFTIADAPFAHAAILSAVTQTDGLIGRSLHDMLRHKTFSCAILPSLQPFARIRLAVYAEAGLSFYNTLLTALSQRPILRIGSATCELQGIELTPSVWSSVASWADLLGGQTSQRITLRFVTPTAIMKTDGTGMRYSQLYPEPFDVFSGLQRRWSALHGPTLVTNLGDRLRDAACVISGYDLKTHTFATQERTQIGYTGDVHYELRNTEPEFVQTVCALARLAHFTGIGYQTARGMGLVQSHIEP
jgi:CRISPR-associated endoribonuclease Cas6